MFRRVVSLVVLCAFVSGQLAAIPHAHADLAIPLDHASRPHVHLHLFEHSGHSHECVRPHDHGVDGSHIHCVAVEKDPLDQDHDGSAVYFPNDVRASLGAQAASPLAVSQLMVVWHVWSSPTVTDGTDPCKVPCFLVECRPAGRLYLELRALRI